MNKLSGLLGDYVTVGMAVEMLGHKRDQTGRFYTLVSKGLETHKVGGMTLAKANEFAEHASLPAGSKPPWPAELASLPMETLLSRDEAANRLGVSPRTINRWANNGTITPVDLSPWGGYTLYQMVKGIDRPKYVSIGDWKLQVLIDDKDRLQLSLAHNQYPHDQLFMGSSLSSHPRKAFIYEDVMTPSMGAITLRESLE